MHGHTLLQEKEAAKIFEVGQRSLERLFPGLTEDGLEQATLGACQSGIGYKRARVVASTAHLGPLIAAKTRFLDMIQDAATAGPIPKQPLLARLDALTEPATAVYLEALDGSETPTAQLYLQKATQAADESWQQTVLGHNGPTVTNPTVSEIEQSGAASQDDDDDDSELTFAPHRKSRLSAPQLQAQLSQLTDRARLRRLKDTLHSVGAWQ